jgi:secernin
LISYVKLKFCFNHKKKEREFIFMCDLLVAMPDTVKNSRTIFAKNSDRPAGECQVLFYSDKSKSNEKNIRCSYVTVPAGKMKYSTMGLRPYWCWGYETGVNEAGVVGGNAAIYTRSLHEPENRETPGLTGMDLLRLGLGRGGSSEEVVDVIIKYLEQYGQWGSAALGKNHDEGSYENAFLIADAGEAWILETTGKRAIAKRISNGIYTLSNQPTIRSEYDKASGDLKGYAAEKGWWDKSDTFDFAYHYSDHEHYARQVSNIRWKRSRELIERETGHIQIQTMMRILRDHYEDTFIDGPLFNRYLPDFLTLCMHDSPAKFTWGDTATSMILEIPENIQQVMLFWLGYLPPCSSVYLPLIFGPDTPEKITATGKQELKVYQPEEAPADAFDDRSLWWRLYRLTKTVAEDPESRYPEMRKYFDELEQLFLNEISQQTQQKTENKLFMQHALNRLEQVIDRLEDKWKSE